MFLLTDVGETGAYVDEFVQMRKLEEISGSDGEKMMLCGSICRRHSLNERSGSRLMQQLCLLSQLQLSITALCVCEPA